MYLISWGPAKRLRISNDGGDRMGAKKTSNNFHAEFLNLKNFQKALK